MNIQVKNFLKYLDQSPAFLTSDYFIRSNEIVIKMADLSNNQPFCSDDLMISI